MGKHAYLIIAHKNFKQIEILISLLDDIRNDIYLLIDKKSANITEFEEPKNSNLYILPSIPIYWGDYSLVQATLDLFKASVTKRSYSYYHLISGQDLPLVTQDEIHLFFDSNPDKIFITFSAMSNSNKLADRTKTHLFRKSYRTSNKNFFWKFYRKLEMAWLPLLKTRYRTQQHSSQWVSLDQETVKTIISEEKWIYESFHKGYLVDEIFIPAIIEKYQLDDKIYYKEPVHDLAEEFQGNLRYINWWDGVPYTFKNSDFNQLIEARNRGFLFARKFDSDIDVAIINEISKSINILENTK